VFGIEDFAGVDAGGFVCEGLSARKLDGEDTGKSCQGSGIVWVELESSVEMVKGLDAGAVPV